MPLSGQMRRASLHHEQRCFPIKAARTHLEMREKGTLSGWKRELWGSHMISCSQQLQHVTLYSSTVLSDAFKGKRQCFST